MLAAAVPDASEILPSRIATRRRWVAKDASDRPCSGLACESRWRSISLSCAAEDSYA